MAAVNSSSAAITNRDATPRVTNDPYPDGVLRSAMGTLEVAAGDAGSIFRYCSVPSNAYVRQVVHAADDIGTTTTIDFGCYYETSRSSGAVIDADFFASAVVVNGGAVARTDITHESGVYGIEDVEKPLWEALGLSEDPKCMIDICGTSVGAADGGGTSTVEVRYVI